MDRQAVRGRGAGECPSGVVERRKPQLQLPYLCAGCQENSHLDTGSQRCLPADPLGQQRTCVHTYHPAEVRPGEPGRRAPNWRRARPTSPVSATTRSARHTRTSRPHRRAPGPTSSVPAQRPFRCPRHAGNALTSLAGQPGTEDRAGREARCPKSAAASRRMPQA
jgi:hypothetical protein